MPLELLTNDTKDLPPFEELKVDEDLAAIQKNDLSEQMAKAMNQHYFSRNYRVLGHGKRVSLWVSLAFIALPLIGYTGYCGYDVFQNRQESLAKFSESYNDDVTKDTISDKDSKNFRSTYLTTNTKDQVSSLNYCDVNIGAQIYKIYNIKPSNEYFSAAMEVWFDFSQDGFHKMFTSYKNDTTIDAQPLAEGETQDQDYFTVDNDTNEVRYGPDSIPDYIELATPFKLYENVTTAIKAAAASNPNASAEEKQALTKEAASMTIKADTSLSSLRKGWTVERQSYPGLHESTIYKDYHRNFDIGKGVDNDTLNYYFDPGEPYYREKLDGTREYRMFQLMTFSCNVSKAYDNPRYPLETAQFWMNIVPTSWLTVTNFRYHAASIVDVSADQVSGSSGYLKCSINEGVYKANGSSTAFTDGFRAINGYPSHQEYISYVVNQDHPELSYSQYTIVMRANRASLSSATFLTSYINLAAVILWVIIAFYNQSYAGEDSLGMLGTGMFSTISATIVAFQMLSDASMFSLLTMINIFTLAVILIMTYQSVSSKRANAKKDKTLIAYNGIKLRAMFFVLTIGTAIMFIALPMLAYIFTV